MTGMMTGAAEQAAGPIKDTEFVLLLISIGAALFVFALILFLFRETPVKHIRKRIEKMNEDSFAHLHETVLSEKKKENRKKRGKSSWLNLQRLEEKLEMAGIRLTAGEFILFWTLLSVVPGVIGEIAGLPDGVSLALCAVGFIIPPLWVKRSKDKVAGLFNKQLCEALTIMGNCMRSGFSFQQALSSIAQEMPPPISTEFSKVVHEVNYGSTMEKALLGMVRRVQNQDLELLISAVLTSMKVGANLSEIMDNIAETVNDRIKLREEIRVYSAQGRMSGIIIGLMPIGVMLILLVLNPGYFTSFVESSIGRLLFEGCVVMEIIGFFVIRKIVNVKY